MWNKYCNYKDMAVPVKRHRLILGLKRQSVETSVKKDEYMEESMPGIHEECGVFGIWSKSERKLPHIVAVGLTALQHRGQEAAGIAVNNNRVISYHKGVGLVHEVFDEHELNSLGSGHIAVGHVRYSTSGNNTVLNAQPMVVKHVKGQLALCHNGNLTNSFELRRKLELSGCIFQTTSDTEVISYLITGNRLKTTSIEQAVINTMTELEGAFSLVMMSLSKLLACRDPHGLRPLCMGKTPSGDIIFASESCALDAAGAALVRELLPGELVVVDEDGVKSLTCPHAGCNPSLCVFEYIYFARSDSVIQGVSVHEARKRAGAFLAQDCPADADIVIGVPDSGLDAAIGYAEQSGIPYDIGLVKNKYIGRTFIAPTQELRDSQVRLKLNAVSGVVKDKRIVLIDDSIVRGTTSAYIVNMLKNAGARQVHMRISSPPFLHPCYYGTDIDSENSLIAKGHSVDEIARIIGADSLAFLPIGHARELAGESFKDKLCSACFDGMYPAGIPKVTQKERFEG